MKKYRIYAELRKRYYRDIVAENIDNARKITEADDVWKEIPEACEFCLTHQEIESDGEEIEDD